MTDVGGFGSDGGALMGFGGESPSESSEESEKLKALRLLTLL